ncbi:5'/3'-nucleotidase SurE [Rubripirellula reticaptiva]|uniref:5'/3'-nucleotidase SurE n=1 Tax=Rubripirellula reticaptiva TaxID=2528013 RepID=UPI001FE7FBD1|nr:5'/3'-nucleotidase SurE [Rubripirellula reticaptiva]
MILNILLTNDDGIDAEGLAALYKSVTAVLPNTATVSVVAPDRGRSECGHSVTTGRPLVIRQHQPGWYSVDGTPVDCVRAAISTLVPKVDAVISGINAGANLGIDLLISGTFAAAREAALQRIPALAASHYRHPDVPKTWDHAPDWLGETLAEFFHSVCEDAFKDDALLWNVNLPAVDPRGTKPSRIECGVDSHPMVRTGQLSPSERELTQKLAMTSEFHGRPRNAGSDVDRCFAGQITLSRMKPQVA